MNKLIVLNVEMKFGESKDNIHPVGLCDDENCVLVDLIFWRKFK